jgi:hypothetical protein
MSTSKLLLGSLKIAMGLLALFTSGCSKEYSGSVLETAQQGFVYDGKGNRLTFTLPEKAIFYTDRSQETVNTTQGNIGLGTDLAELYWSTQYQGAQKYSEGNQDYVRFRFAAKNKKTAVEIEKFRYLWKTLSISWTAPSNSELVSDRSRVALVKEYGESEAASFIAKVSNSRNLVLAGTKELRANSTSGSVSHSSTSSASKSARQLILERAHSLHGRNADVDITSGFYGDAYQVNISDHERFRTWTYAVEVSEKAQKITAWQLTAHN